MRTDATESMPFCRHAFVDNRLTVSVRVLMMAASESSPFCLHALVDSRFTVSVRVLMMAARLSSPFCRHALVESSNVSRLAAMRDHLLPVLSQ
jgi:hypothetical protein